MTDNYQPQPYVTDLATKEVLDYSIYNTLTKQFCSIKSTDKNDEYLGWCCKLINQEINNE